MQTQDRVDAIDFTDNDLSTLAHFPLSPRLRVLLLARNRINSIHMSLSTSMPNLESLTLTSNNLSELADLDTLQHLVKLTHLTLLDNPVTRREVRHRDTCPPRYLTEYAVNSITGTGSSGVAQAFGTSIIRKSKTMSVSRRSSSLELQQILPPLPQRYMVRFTTYTYSHPFESPRWKDFEFIVWTWDRATVNTCLAANFG